MRERERREGKGRGAKGRETERGNNLVTRGSLAWSECLEFGPPREDRNLEHPNFSTSSPKETFDSSGPTLSFHKCFQFQKGQRYPESWQKSQMDREAQLEEMLR
jgi:hypothetical protein